MSMPPSEPTPRPKRTRKTSDTPDTPPTPPETTEPPAKPKRTTTAASKAAPRARSRKAADADAVPKAPARPAMPAPVEEPAGPPSEPIKETPAPSAPPPSPASATPPPQAAGVSASMAAPSAPAASSAVPMTPPSRRAETPALAPESNALPTRVMNLLRTLALRNIAIWRRWAGISRQRVEKGWMVASSRFNATAQNSAEPLRQVRESVGGAVRTPYDGLNRALDSLQSRLETSDSAVIVLTLVLIAACVVLSIVLWNVL